jgi:hypothetical protein
MKHRRWILAGALLILGCSKNKGAVEAQDGRTSRETKIVLEKCDVTSESAERFDANGDGRPEIVKVKSGAREVCRTVDLNFDGKIDRTTFFDEGGKIRRVESDFDRDGRIDELAIFDKGQLKEKHRATTMDGKLDTWEFYENGRQARTERDENGDGFIDQWWEYPSRGCPLIHMDTDGDGRPDPGSSIDYCKETGYTPPPVPGEDEGPEKAADFGSSKERIEETSNQAVDEDGTPVEEMPPVQESGSEGGDESTGEGAGQ